MTTWCDLAVRSLSFSALRAAELRPNVTAYDACYVALAEAVGFPLRTADRRLANAPGLRCALEVV